MIKLKKITLLLLIISNGIISTCFADDEDIRYYDVEIIVFENTRTKYLQSEFWKKNLVQTEPETFVQIGQTLPVDFPETYIPQLTFKHIENTDYRLNDIVTSLNESNDHRVLLHSAWRQPGLSKTDAINVKIEHFIPPENTNENISENNSENTQITLKNNNNFASAQYISQFSTTEYTDENNKPNKGFVLSGYIKLILSRYLHLKIDLVYHEQANEIAEQIISNEFGEDELLPDIFHILQTRRLRSKELHYIDHPVISIIALITPYKLKNN
ncbi:hypothetical protein MNBD_GAMMA22-784 [hydrothermal vent metagenome]|uniref:Uncharacterized protein n=1 Tax=hydrothermal vent metagenome TaxID=652676 RepID=A0A3B1ALN0_9ZZZZ